MSVPPTLEKPALYRSDEILVGDCLRGERAAWDELIDKYKNLIYSIPVKYGLRPEDAQEVFQTVCLTLLDELDKLREARALPAWLMQTAARRCYRVARQNAKVAGPEIETLPLTADPDDIPEQVLQQVQQEEILRSAVRDLKPECRHLISVLFYRDPPLPYDEAAQQLGMAKGSMGATRGRCLKKLRELLEKRGLS